MEKGKNTETLRNERIILSRNYSKYRNDYYFEAMFELFS